MTTKNPKNVIELRRLLAEKFPGVRMAAGSPERLVQRWPSGVPQLDLQLEGGFAKSALTEVISTGLRSGSALLLAALIRQASRNGEWSALIDGADCFDPAGLGNAELARFLWVRCSSTPEAMKAADLLLHDGTIPVLAIDLIRCAPKQLRRIPSSTWHRMARTVEQTATVCVILTPEKMIATAETRIELTPRFTLESLEESQQSLIEQILPKPAEVEARKKRFGTAG